MGVRVAHLFSVLVVLVCVIMFRVPCCHVRYDFRIILAMFGSSVLPVVCRRARVLFMLFVFVWPVFSFSCL